ncbi:hypothetical protein A11A3_11718 [Alcanivorax hongdengensis A-11-3]|uniref:Uncharacterized protein n=1 Tax=Alcanivorax hongdengensis A-11-3 TaxID=1177179 RepID=L0WDL8_9GAMM|nr:hypothetical protein [Alcanivorax hongdengensis]EKF73875.1 hypothetical protein A11A3_11718 [Alcanivorax hongdengensis A-11-3]
MKKIVIAMVIILYGSASVMADESDDCIDVAKAVSDLQLALAGMGDIDNRVARVSAMGDKFPEFKASLSGMVAVVEGADDESPLQNIDMEAFDHAEAAYKEQYKAQCGEL